MIHEKEIIRWAKSPNGTGVWYKTVNNNIWSYMEKSPSWLGHIIYIVDDEWADIRKAAADGKTIQFKNTNGEFFDVGFTINTSTENLNRDLYRIKPDTPDIPVDTKMLVWRNKDKEHCPIKRHFSHFDELGRCHCFKKGKTSFTGYSTSSWDCYEIYNEDG